LSMLAFVAQRLFFTIVVLLCAMVFVFLISHVVPADPARMAMGQFATEDAVAKYRRDNGLDQPLPVQFTVYLQHLLQGDLGRSILTTRPVAEELLAGVAATVELVLPALALGAILGV